MTIPLPPGVGTSKNVFLSPTEKMGPNTFGLPSIYQSSPSFLTSEAHPNPVPVPTTGGGEYTTIDQQPDWWRQALSQQVTVPFSVGHYDFNNPAPQVSPQMQTMMAVTPQAQPQTQQTEQTSQSQQNSQPQMMASVPQVQSTPTGQFVVGTPQPQQSTIQIAGSSTPGKKPSTTTTKTISSQAGPKPKKKTSSLDKYLGKDADYQATLRDLARSLTDFKARQGVEKSRAGAEYSYQQHTMNSQKDLDLRDILDDFAARGIATSGVYAGRVGDYNSSFNDQMAELGRQYNNQLSDFALALTDFNRQQSLQKEAARQAAIRRRSAKLGKIS